MNKNNKIWINYGIGAIIFIFLLLYIVRQVAGQYHQVQNGALLQTDGIRFLIVAVLLMIVNFSVEVYKWYLLAGSSQGNSAKQVVYSFFAGMALSLVTPNRIGEYPGRILYLRKGRPYGLIKSAVPAITAQFGAIIILGVAAFYVLAGLNHLQLWWWGAIFSTLIFIILLSLYKNSVQLTLRFRHMKWLRHISTFGRLMSTGHTGTQYKIWGLSLLKVLVFTAQYLFLLRWMHVELPLLQGFCVALVFFWAMAVLPSVAIAELGIRGALSMYLFGLYSGNMAGILAATACLWAMNLALPAICGSVLLFRMKFLS